MNIRHKQLKTIDAQGFRDFFQTDNGNVFFASFQTAEIIGREFGLHSESFLSKASRFPKISNVSRDDFDQIHKAQFNRIDV
jgi:hypothetical protein